MNRLSALWAFLFTSLGLSGCGQENFDSSDSGGITPLGAEGFVGLGKSVSSNGFYFPLASKTSWDNGNYGACGYSSPTYAYFSGYCHTGNDMSAAQGTSVYSLAAGTVLYRSDTQNAVCSSGWGKDSGGTGTCNMALAIQYYDDDGTPFVIVVGHLRDTSTFSYGSTVTPGQELGKIADWYYCNSYSVTSSCSGGWTDGGDHLHFGVFPNQTYTATAYSTAFPTTGWGRVACSTSQAASTSLPSSCSSNGATAPGTFVGASGRNWVAPPVAPTLTSPAYGASVTLPVNLQWTNGSGTYRSHVMVCTNEALTTGCFNPDSSTFPYIGEETLGTGAARSTSYSASTGLSTGVTYYWSVQSAAYNDYLGWGSYGTQSGHPAGKFTTH